MYHHLLYYDQRHDCSCFIYNGLSAYIILVPFFKTFGASYTKKIRMNMLLRNILELGYLIYCSIIYLFSCIYLDTGILSCPRLETGRYSEN